MTHYLRATALALLLGGLTAGTINAQDREVEAMKRQLAELQERLAAIESRPALQLGTPQEMPRSAIRDRHSLNDRQIPAARPNSLAIDPELNGFMPVFGSSVVMRFNAKPRVDTTLDSTDTGSNFRFVPAKLPMPGDDNYGGGTQFSMNANGTQLSFEVRDPGNPNGIRFYYQNDFFGENDANMRYRLQHAYGQAYNVVAGFTFGLFEDPDIWPDTVDYEGPNALIFARRPVLQYIIPFDDEWHMTLGIEQPDISLDTTAAPNATLVTRAPDAGFNFRWEREGGSHMQTSALFRSIGVNEATERQYEFAWGANVAVLLPVTERDDVGVYINGGEGIGGLGNDTSFVNSDAAIDSNGDLVALSYFSVMGTLRHEWSDDWRSTATYGYVSLQSVDGQAGDAYERSHYASANVIYRFAPKAQVGLEVLYGDKSVRDGLENDAFRVQLGIAYSIF